MNRSLASLFAIALPAALAACSVDATSHDATARGASAIESSLTRSTTNYEGSFAVKGATFGVRLSISQPTSSISYEKIRSSKFYLDSRGGCDAYVESPKVQVRLVVTDDYGTVLADDTKETSANSSKNLDGKVECPDGFLVYPAVVTSLETTIDRVGLGLELSGQGVQVPAGYGAPGSVFVKAAAKFAAQSPLTVSHSQDSAYNQSKAEVERGVLAIALPREVTLNVGLGVVNGLATEMVPVTLLAR